MMMKKTVHRICAATCALASLASLAFLAAAPAAHAADAPVTSPTTPARPAKAGPKQAARPLADRLQAICSSADLNHDGNVSLDEFHQDIVQSWHSLGPDAQGYVHLAQLGQVPRIGKGALRRLAAADKDADGKLSFSEVVQARMAYFEAADGNQDDLLSLQECIAYERQRRRQPQ